MVAVAVAAVGMVLIVLPGLTLAGSHNLVPGVVCGLVAGACLRDGADAHQGRRRRHPRLDLHALLLRLHGRC